MSVFVRKFLEGGTSNLEGNNTSKPRTEDNMVPTLTLGDYRVNINDFSKDLENNFQKFYDAYEETWTNKEKKDILKQHESFLNNLRAGNIVSINDDNTFSVRNTHSMDFSENGGWNRYSYFVKLIANNIKPKKEAAPKKKFTTTSLLSDITNRYLPGDNPDYQSWFDRDEIIENPDGTKTRNTINRTNALLDLINDEYLSQYDSADETFGDLEGVKARIVALRRALANGKLDNEDYQAAAALGLNLRTLLSTDANLKFDTNGNFTTESETESSVEPTDPQSRLSKVLNDAKGQSDPNEIIARIENWDVNATGFNLKWRPTTASFDLEIEFQAKQRNLKDKALIDRVISRDYKTIIFPQLFRNLKSYLANPNEILTLERTKRRYRSGDYATQMLTFAIRNKSLRNGDLLPDNVKDELNELLLGGKNTGFWTIPGSFDEEKGTILTFNPSTGEYRTISIKTPGLKLIIKGSPVSPLEEYAAKNGLLSVNKNGGKFLQLGGYINQLYREKNGDDRTEYSMGEESLKRLGIQQTVAPTPLQQTSPENPQQQSEQEAYLLQQVNLGKLSDADLRELSSAGLDLVSLGSAYIPGYGTAASLLTGLASTGLHTWNLATDKDGFTLSDLGETLGNVGLDVAGLLPFFGTGAKGEKLLKVITKYTPILLTGFGVMQLPEAAASLKKLTTEGISSLTVQDYRNLTNGIMALTGAGTYAAGRAKAGAMRELSGNVPKKSGEIEVKINGEKKTLKIDSEELPQFKEKLKNAENADAANKVLRESPSIKKQVQDVEQVSISKPPHKIKGVGVDARGLTEKTEIVSGENTLGNTSDEQLFRWALEKSERLMNLRNPIKSPFNKESWKAAYVKKNENNISGVLKQLETPKQEAKQETPKQESEVSKLASEQVNEAPVQNNESAPVLNNEPVENKATENKSTETNNSNNNSNNTEQLAEKPRENVEKVNEEQKAKSNASKKATNRNANNVYSTRRGVRNIARGVNSETKTKLLNYLSGLKKGERVDLKKVKEILNGYNEELSLFSKNGSKLQRVIEFKQKGGPTGVGLNPGTTWRNNVFNKYRELILRHLKESKGDDYGYWLNDMQSRHAQIYKDAGGDSKKWRTTAYRSDNVGKYQQDYKGGLNGQFNGTYTPGYSDNFNEYGIRPAQKAGRYDISGPRRTSGDYGNHNYQVDNLYSSITDDRRLLGRKGDWDDQSLNEWNKQLLNVGWRMELDKSDGYYKLHRIGNPNDINPNGVSVLPNPTTIPDKIQLNTGTTNVPGGGDERQETGDDPLGTRRRIDLYKYIPATLAFGRMIGDNISNRRITEEYLGKLLAPLQQPWQFHRQVYGDYGALKYAEDQAAQIRSQMNRPVTSNATLASLRQLEGERLAAEQRWKGFAADNQRIHETYEKSAAEQKANTERATTVANTNRALLASLARDKAGIWAAMRRKNHENFDNWLMGYVEKPIQEEAYRRKAYQDMYDQINIGPLQYDPSNDVWVQTKRKELEGLASDDPRREQILKEVEDHVITESKNHRAKVLGRIRRLNPWLINNFPSDPTWNTTSEKEKIPNKADGGIMNFKKGGSSYPTAVIRAKSKDNDRLIKQILEIIRNNKDLAKGVKLTDYSKYIVKK